MYVDAQTDRRIQFPVLDIHSYRNRPNSCTLLLAFFFVFFF